MKYSFFKGCIAFILACNYFAFQVELFEDEYEQNHPSPTRILSISRLSTTWESFDKENAPQEFYFDADLHLECLLVLQPPVVFESIFAPPFHPVRDKSPPVEEV